MRFSFCWVLNPAVGNMQKPNNAKFLPPTRLQDPCPDSTKIRQVGMRTRLLRRSKTPTRRSTTLKHQNQTKGQAHKTKHKRTTNGPHSHSWKAAKHMYKDPRRLPTTLRGDSPTATKGRRRHGPNKNRLLTLTSRQHPTMETPGDHVQVPH